MEFIRYTVTKPTHGSQEWLNIRWRDEDGFTRISASVAGAVHNQGWGDTSMADLAVQLLSDTAPEPIEANAAMDRGNRLELPLLNWFADVEKMEILTPEIMYAYSTTDNKLRLIATLDGITPNGIPVEIKTTKKMWTGVLPPMWRWQGIQQAICVGSSRVEWGIFDSNLELHRYTQHISSDETQDHLSACRAFLSATDRGEIPTGADLTYKHVAELHPKGNAVRKECDPEIAGQLVADLETSRRLKAEAEEWEDKLKKEIALLLGDADTGCINGEPFVTWKSATRESFDSTKFSAMHPALAEKFRKTTSYRVMRITNKKGAK